MKFKLDENLGVQGAEILRKDGHDVATVYEQKLSGAQDRQVIEVCRAEKRCLVTLDLDFANPLVFHPADYSGIAVLRLPRKPSQQDLLNLVETLRIAIAKEDLVGKLWIVEPSRIRIHKDD